MANRQPFGRRIGPQVQVSTAAPRVGPVAPSVAALFAGAPANDIAPATPIETTSVDQELEEWKRSGKPGFKIPWSQLSLMASLCFGIASFALPDSVNNSVQWLLLALMAASGWVWFSNRRKKAALQKDSRSTLTQS